jgi:hypothetical protein
LSSAFIIGRRWPREEIRGLNPEKPFQPVHNVNAGSVNTSLKGADVGTIDLRTMRQLLLRQAVGSPELPQIECQHLSHFHARAGRALKSISPRSILDKDANATVDTFQQVQGRVRNCEYSDSESHDEPAA